MLYSLCGPRTAAGGQRGSKQQPWHTHRTDAFLLCLDARCRPKKTPKVVNKAPKFYPADDIPVKAPSARELASKGIAKLRKSIQPGTVLILLAGRFRGRRVVFLKQLPSGLLLVTGPYAVNGIPLRRVNQAYVIATSAKVDISKVKADKFGDAYFMKAKVPKSQKKKKEEDFFAEGGEKTEATPERKADQAAVDGALKCDDMMKKYLKATFSLSKRDVPHKMIF